mgnify:FL=1
MGKFEETKRDIELQWKDEKGNWKWEEIIISLLAIPVAFYVGAHLVMFFFRLIAPS